MAYIIEESNISSENLAASALFDGGAVTKNAQTFAANRNYTLQAIALHVFAFTPPLSTTGGIYSVSGGEPDVRLEDFTITATQGLGNGQEEIAILNSPLVLTENVQYAIVIDAPTTDYFYWSYIHAGSTYANGAGFNLFSGTWTPLTGDDDYYFKTLSIFSLAPTPENGTAGIVLYPTLSWEGGLPTYTYDVYFGETGNMSLISSGQEESSIIVPNVLEYNTEYQWRVDTTTETETITGDVWSFTTIEFAPPSASVDASQNPTGINNMVTLKRLVVAANNKIFYET